MLSRMALRIEFGLPDAPLLQRQLEDRLRRLSVAAAERLEGLLRQRGLERAENGRFGGVSRGLRRFFMGFWQVSSGFWLEMLIFKGVSSRNGR